MALVGAGVGVSVRVENRTVGAVIVLLMTSVVAVAGSLPSHKARNMHANSVIAGSGGLYRRFESRSNAGVLV